MKTEKHYYKLADYFVTIGLDNSYTPEEVYKSEDGNKRESMLGPDGSTIPSGINDSEVTNATMDQQRQSLKQEQRNQVEDFKIIEDDDSGLLWNRIVKSLEILVI